jgi:hypothetical protein
VRRAEGLRIALLAAWAGSMITYALFAVRPAFQVGIPSTLAANLLAHGFLGLDRFGIFAGLGAVALCLGTLPRSQRLATRLRLLAPLVGAVFHGVSYLWITPEIEALRELAGGAIGQLPTGSSSLERFASLHELSQRLYVAAAVSALAVLIWDLLALGRHPSGAGTEQKTA